MITKLQFLMLIVAHGIDAALNPESENVCLKEKIIQKTQMVNRYVTEEETTTSMCWSLYNFFRCEQKKPVLRLKKVPVVTKRTEYLLECCDGFMETLNGNCLPQCSQCANGICAGPENCKCRPGFKKPFCIAPCSPNEWGEDCKEKCECFHGETCDSVTGLCFCEPGWRGPRCNFPCPEGYYGHQCQEMCKCNNQPCHHVSGDCLSFQKEPTTEKIFTNKENEETIIEKRQPDYWELISGDNYPDSIEFTESVEITAYDNKKVPVLHEISTEFTRATEFTESVEITTYENKKVPVLHEMSTEPTRATEFTEFTELTELTEFVEFVDSTDLVEYTESVESTMPTVSTESKKVGEFTESSSSTTSSNYNETVTLNDNSRKSETEPFRKLIMLFIIIGCSFFCGLLIVTFIGVRWMLHRRQTIARNKTLQKERELFDSKIRRKYQESLFAVKSCSQDAYYMSEASLQEVKPIFQTFKPDLK